MKIDDRISSYMALLKTDAPNVEAAPKAPQLTAANQDAESVEVELSQAAVQLAEDEARRERLELIRQQLAEGSYNISGKDVAKKIINVLKN